MSALQHNRPRCRVWTALLMAGLTLCFAAQQVVVVHFEKPYDTYLALSGYGMKSWHLWEVFTCQFVHAGWAHWLLNLAGLAFVARAAETAWGGCRFLRVYLGLLLAGAAVQGVVAVAGFLLPESLETVAAFLRDRFGGPLAGASIGLCGVFAVLCRENPARTFRLLFFVPVKAAHLLWGALGLSVVWLVLATLWLAIPDNLALPHLAHLVALAAGMVFFRPAPAR